MYTKIAINLYLEENNIILVVVLLLLSSTRAKTSSQSSIDTTVHHKLDVPDRPSCIDFTAPYCKWTWDLFEFMLNGTFMTVILVCMDN